MSLTEREVVDRIRTSLRESIDACKDLAVASWRGIPYDRLRTHLILVEGACRQLFVFREDARWLVFGLKMHEVHMLAGNWLRGYSKNGIHHTWTIGQTNEMFVKLAAELIIVLGVLDRLLEQRTGTAGPILPQPVDERRLGRPAYENRAKSKRGKLLVPPKYRTA